MFLAKHHYAINLAKRGNQVYFINPPVEKHLNFTSTISISNSNIHSNLFIVDHTLFFTNLIRFHLKWLYRKLIQIHINYLIRKIGRPIDLIWSFELAGVYPFNCFSKNSSKILFPVDEPHENNIHQLAHGADFIFSVTKEIIDKFKEYNIPKHFINHGVDEAYIRGAFAKKEDQIVRVGISGNLLRPDLDRNTMLSIITQHPSVVFEIWGSYEKKQSNIGGEDDSSTTSFVNKLKALPNVILHGVVNPKDLSTGLHRMDAFLICYDVKKDQSKGTNYHKIMEYLSTGKVVIANNISTYESQPDLVQMVRERDTNYYLSELFRKIILDISSYNTKHLQEYRINFCKAHLYTEQINKIEKLIY